MPPMDSVPARVLDHCGPRPLWVFFAVAAALGAPATAIADQPADAARALALVQEAKALTAAKRYADACPKLAESQRLDPKTGTLLSLALCYQSEGKPGSAWTAF